MKIATYNVNGVNGRLPVLLEWLPEARPLKAPREKPAADARWRAKGKKICASSEAPVPTKCADSASDERSLVDV